MSGLAKLCKFYGSMVINGKKFVWDYAADQAVPEREMPVGSERWKASERERWKPHACEVCGKPWVHVETDYGAGEHADCKCLDEPQP